MTLTEMPGSAITVRSSSIVTCAVAPGSTVTRTRRT